MKARVWLFLAVVAVSACQVEEPTKPRMLGQAAMPGLSDGTSGGNPEFFFYQPLIGDPSGSPNFDVGASNPFLAPYAIVCEITNTPGPNDCIADVTPVAGGLSMALSGEIYQRNWRTSDAPGLSSAKFYRVEVFAVPVSNRLSVTAEYIEKFRYGYRDIDPEDGPSVSDCKVVAFCKINNGSSIPIKVRIENFASCPETRSCASEVVLPDQTNNLKQPNGNQITVPGQSNSFFLNFDVCSAAENAAVEAAIDLPTFGPCFKTETPFTGTLSAPATVSICEALTFIPAQYANNKDVITLHHFDTENGTPTNPITKVEALSEANNCLTVTGDAGEASGLARLGRVVARSIGTFLNPRPLHAAVALDVGGGGLTDDLSSFFKLALPGKFEFVNAADALQIAPTGSAVTLKAKVTDLQGLPILNARVTWNVQSSPASGASLTPPAIGFTDASGLAQVVLNLSSTSGANVVHAAGKGIADPRESGCARVGDSNTSCNGFRTSYDPFIPRNDHVDGSLGTLKEQLATGTRLEYTVIGCKPGEGTAANINGVLAANEWACANSRQFPVSLSGGAATATLYWMNTSTTMYIAVSVPGTGRDNSLRLDWDSNGNSAGLAQGSRELGDDVWEFVPPTGTSDKYIDSKCVGSGQSNCGLADGGASTNQTTAAFRNDLGGVTIYEMSHPLSTSDFVGSLRVDINAATAGQKLGMFLTLRTGSGAQGNTQWPGFQKYMEVIIR